MRCLYTNGVYLTPGYDFFTKCITGESMFVVKDDLLLVLADPDTGSRMSDTGHLLSYRSSKCLHIRTGNVCYHVSNSAGAEHDLPYVSITPWV